MIKRLLVALINAVLIIAMLLGFIGIIYNYPEIEKNIAARFFLKGVVIYEEIPVLDINRYGYDKKKFNHNIRLHNKKDQFFCSGTVITDTVALTAAHCVTEETKFGHVLKSKIVLVKDKDQKKAFPSRVSAIDLYNDAALLIGNFKDFNKISISFGAKYFFETKDKNLDITGFGIIPRSKVFTCGFPRGVELSCYKADFLGVYFDRYEFRSTIYRGMSGGPTTIDGVQFGINMAMTRSSILITPIFPLKQSFKLKFK